MDLDVLLAGLSSIPTLRGTKVVSKDDYEDLERRYGQTHRGLNGQLTAEQLFSLTSLEVLPTAPVKYVGVLTRIPSDQIDFDVSSLSGQRYPMRVGPEAKVNRLKQEIERQAGIPPPFQRLVVNKKELTNDDWAICDYVTKGSTVRLIDTSKVDGFSYLHIKDLVDSEYNYDFTDVHSDDLPFSRGGQSYERPLGFKRFALKVDKYGDKSWLGQPDRFETDSSPGEWRVSYHGTNEPGVIGIAELGYDLSRSRRFRHGPGIYSTPSVACAKVYANKFVNSKNGVDNMMIMQNRVNPVGLDVIPPQHTNMRLWAEFFVTAPEGIRPYGICIKEAEGSITESQKQVRRGGNRMMVVF